MVQRETDLAVLTTCETTGLDWLGHLASPFTGSMPGLSLLLYTRKGYGVKSFFYRPCT